MKLYRLFWKNEGLYCRRGDILIKKPTMKGGKFYIRVINTQGVSNRQETTDERDAFRRGDAWYRLLKIANWQPK